MNGRTKLNEVLALVDMTKVNLPSYNIAVGKYDAIAEAYTKVIFLCAVATLRSEMDDDSESAKLHAIAKKTIEEIVENPKRYYYEEAVVKEKAWTEKVAYDYWGSRSESDPKVRKAIAQARKQRMIRLMQEMLSTLHSAEQSYSDEVLDICMDDAVFENTLTSFASINDEATVSESDNSASLSNMVDAPVDHDADADVCVNVGETAVQECGQPTSFWGKVKSFFSR